MAYKQQKAISQFWKLGSSRSRYQQSSSGESPLPPSWTAIFLLFPHLAKRARDPSGVSFTRALLPFMNTRSSWPSYLSETPPPNIVTVGIMFQHTHFEGIASIKSRVTLWNSLVGSHKCLWVYSILKDFQGWGGSRTLDCVALNFRAYIRSLESQKDFKNCALCLCPLFTDHPHHCRDKDYFSPFLKK